MPEKVELSFTIVGAQYRPPATEIMHSIPVGTRLILRHEPFNKYDKNAIAVFIDSSDISEASYAVLHKERQLGRYHITVSDIRNTRLWQLGYLPANVASKLHQKGWPKGDVEAMFYLTPSGQPQARFTLEKKQ